MSAGVSSCRRAAWSCPAARVVRDSGLPDVVVPTAMQLPIEQLPDECLVYLMGSRYCETDKLTDLAWSLFKDTRPGWERVQAICDYVHNHLTFGYRIRGADQERAFGA